LLEDNLLSGYAYYLGVNYAILNNCLKKFYFNLTPTFLKILIYKKSNIKIENKINTKIIAVKNF